MPRQFNKKKKERRHYREYFFRNKPAKKELHKLARKRGSKLIGDHSVEKLSLSIGVTPALSLEII